MPNTAAETTSKTKQDARTGPLEFKNGIRIAGTDLWMDARSPRDLSFVSHAHTDHLARHASIIATEPTARFCRERAGVTSALIVPYNQPFALGELTIELCQAGHILGSSQILVRLPRALGGMSIGYTGDFCNTDSFTAGRAEQLKCDVLVVEATFGKPHYAFPTRGEALAVLEETVKAALARGMTPVIYAYPLGKSQEVIKFLDDGGFKVRAHKSIWENCRIYQEFGVKFSGIGKFTDEVRHGEILVLPHNSGRSRGLSCARQPYQIAVTGWAIDPATKYRLGVDEAIPLSDHADFTGLVSYVLASGAKKVYVVHGFVDELVAALLERGVDASPLVPPRQMPLPLVV